MGDDFYNPFTAETYIKRAPWWQILLGEALWIAGIVAFVWIVAVVVFSLGKVVQ